MGRIQLIREITRALEANGGEASTSAIMDFIDENYKWGASKCSVSNLLSRHPQFIKIDFLDFHVPSNGFGPAYRVRESVWRLQVRN